jgi:hypothetical protein
MARPTAGERKATIETLANKLEQEHYKEAADAFALMDLTPQALGVEADAIRVMTRAVTMHLSGQPVEVGRSTTMWLRNPTSNNTPRRTFLGFLRDIVGSINFRKNEKTPGIEDNESVDELGRVFEERKPGQDKTGVQIEFAGRPFQLPISRGIDMTARVIVSLVAGIFLLAPMFALSYMNNKIWRLVTTSLFTLVFSVALSVMSSAKNQEIMAATAAYTAVLVVFLGQTTDETTV